MAAAFSLDTSVVLRLLVGEPDDLFQVAFAFLEEQLAAGATVHISDLVLAEAYFALQSFYHIPKKEALETLAVFILQSGVSASPAAISVLTMPNLATAKPGFVDRLIHGVSQSGGATLVTFEKAAKKLPGTRILSLA